jgi:acetylglutamate kinase
VNTNVVNRLLAAELIPVIATIGADDKGQAYNINADTAAGVVAVALEAEKLVFLTDVDGIRRDRDDPASTISTLSADDAKKLIDNGIVADGMVPKVRACIEAVRGGVGHAHILDGRAPRALLLEIFTPEGIGTMVTP